MAFFKVAHLRHQGIEIDVPDQCTRRIYLVVCALRSQIDRLKRCRLHMQEPQQKHSSYSTQCQQQPALASFHRYKHRTEQDSAHRHTPCDL
jgi:hypothetical protein